MSKETHCPFEVLVNMINGKWKMIILWHLNKDGFKHFGKLQRIAFDSSSKVLSTQLRQLEKDSLISRKVYPEVPPKVEYYITHLEIYNFFFRIEYRKPYMFYSYIS